MEILLSPVAGLLILFISRCSIKTGWYCRFGETIKPFFWEPMQINVDSATRELFKTMTLKTASIANKRLFVILA
jgi:hypothetical protein